MQWYTFVIITNFYKYFKNIPIYVSLDKLLYSYDNVVGNSTIYVAEDDQKPVINGTFNKAIRVNVNESVKFDEVKFSDNLTSANKIRYACLAKNPDGIISRIAEGEGSSVTLEYTFTIIGKWTVIWSAEDEIGNISYAELTVYVE